MREGRIGQAAEIDDVGAGFAHARRACPDFVYGERRGIDDLGEDAHVVAGEIRRVPALAEIGREVFQLLGTALERHRELRAQSPEIRPAAARQQDAIGLHRPRQAAGDDGLGHQRGDLDADVVDGPVEARVGKLGQHLLEPRSREMSGQEQDSLGHCFVRPSGQHSPSPARAERSAIPAARSGGSRLPPPHDGRDRQCRPRRRLLQETAGTRDRRRPRRRVRPPSSRPAIPQPA